MKVRLPELSRVGRGGGTLFVLAGMFLLSGMLRLWDGANAAISDPKESASNIEQAQENHCATSEGLAAAFDAVLDREDRVITREMALAERVAALEVADATVSAKLVELVAAEERLSATVALSESAAEDDLSRLTSVYENMKPKEAAVLFTRMDAEFAAGFLGRMRADAAASILAGLDPEAAYAISVLMAGRNVGAPTE